MELHTLLTAVATEIQAVQSGAAVDYLPEADVDELADLRVVIAPAYTDGEAALDIEPATRDANRNTASVAVALQQHIPHNDTNHATLKAVAAAAREIVDHMDRRDLADYSAARWRRTRILAAPSPEHLARRVVFYLIVLAYEVIE